VSVSAGAALGGRERASLRDALRTRLALVVVLVAAAVAAWWWTSDQMRGMDGGPWTSLGAFGWFLGIWVVMMAAMMFPSLAPTAALYSQMTRMRSPLSPLAFVSGYLLVWSAAGIVAYAIGAGIGAAFGDVLRWDRAGRWAAGTTLLIAALYEFTPLKDVCLGKCRSPLGFLLGTWREGPVGGLRMGAQNGAWCLGCCWALMASLFAVGVMSLAWMAAIAGLIGFEKLIPSRRLATNVTAAVLLGLGVLLFVSPQTIPGLHTPGDGMTTSDMAPTMGS
jgi:predicted metal-binding membrane protein